MFAIIFQDFLRLDVIRIFQKKKSFIKKNTNQGFTAENPSFPVCFNEFSVAFCLQLLPRRACVAPQAPGAGGVSFGAVQLDVDEEDGLGLLHGSKAAAFQTCFAFF